MNDARRVIVFVSSNLSGESLRHARAIAKLARVRLLAISERLPEGREEIFAEVVCVPDLHDPDQLTAAARDLAKRHGALDRIVTMQELLLEPVAKASETLELAGLNSDTVRRLLDKSRLKQILRKCGIDSPRDQVVTNSEDARRFASEASFPIVLKPLCGSGGLATCCIRSPEQLEVALDLLQPSQQEAVLAEQFVNGQELCFDTITVANEPRFHSICCYRPSILDALEDRRIKWSCVMPRDISGEMYREFIAQGFAAVRALSVGNAFTHMEGFLLNEGGVCFTDATLRPAGARIGPMLAHAYDIDPYHAWARVAVDGCVDAPAERKYAVGTVFLRGMGDGAVEEVVGVESVRREVGTLIVDARLPHAGAAKAVTYTGDGYITVRHPETQAVEDALKFIAQMVQIKYSHPESNLLQGEAIEWEQRLRYFHERRYKPAWEDDPVHAVTE